MSDEIPEIDKELEPTATETVPEMAEAVEPNPQ